MNALCCLTPPVVRALPGNPLLCDGIALEVNGSRVDIMVRRDEDGVLSISAFQRVPNEKSLLGLAFIQRAVARLGHGHRVVFALPEGGRWEVM